MLLDMIDFGFLAYAFFSSLISQVKRCHLLEDCFQLLHIQHTTKKQFFSLFFPVTLSTTSSMSSQVPIPYRVNPHGVDG
jgi:hypothetical protein